MANNNEALSGFKDIVFGKDRSRADLFTDIGKTLTAVSLGLQGKDPSGVFESEEKSNIGLEMLKRLSNNNSNAINNAAIDLPDNISRVNIPIGGGASVTFENRNAEIKQAEEIAKAKKEAELSVPERLSDSQIKDIQGQIDTVSKLTDNALLLSSNKDFEDLLGPLGTVAPVKRFFERFDDEGSGKAFIDSIEQSFQTYRKAITGVQAGFREIEFLREIFPSTNDKPDAFINKAFLANRMTLNSLQRQLPVLEALGKDTSKLQSLQDFYQGQLDQVKSVMSPESIEALEIDFINRARENDIPLAGESVVADSMKQAEQLSKELPPGTQIIVGIEIFEVE